MYVYMLRLIPDKKHANKIIVKSGICILYSIHFLKLDLLGRSYIPKPQIK